MLHAFGTVDVASLVIVVVIIGLFLQGIYRLLLGSKRRTILPPTEINLPEFESAAIMRRRDRRIGRRTDRSNVALPSGGLGEGSGVLGVGIQESAVNEDGASAFSERLKREGAKRGAVQISLLWNNWNDLDLHIITPSGEHIFHDNRKSACGGELDLDMNFKPTSKTPVENVVWTKTPPAGTYRVGVRHYRVQHKNAMLSKIPLISRFVLKNETDFKVSVTIGGSQRVYEGTIAHNKMANELLFIAKFAIAESKDGDVRPKEVILTNTKSSKTKEDVGQIDGLSNLSVALEWDTKSDIGLSVMSPSGKNISFLDIGNTEGEIFNFDTKGQNQSIKWKNEPEKGEYSLFVNQFELENSSEETPFKISVNNGGNLEEFEGIINEDGANIEVGSFIVD